MKEMKRILSLFLCLAMLVGYLPVGAMATENEGAQLETTAPVETVLLTADGENEETEKNTEPVVTDPAVTEPVDPKTVVPETTAPETTVPETTVPETTVPETTVPETTVPETTVPEETEPEETVPEETKPQDDAWTKYQEALKRYEEALKRYEELHAKLEASHKLAMEKEAAEKAAKKPSFFLEVAGGASDTAAAAVALADNPIYVLAGGDFQEAGDHAGSAENVRNILAQIGQKYDTMDGFLFVGDYDCETHESDDNGQTAAGITALMGAVQNSYSNINDANSILVQGNHDIKESRIDATDGHDFDGYSVFVMNEDDYPDGGGTEAGVKALAEKLKTWLNTKLGEGYDAPIFITSHLPLAFSPRTNVVGDGKYAKLIFDVLNHAAGEGLNIIFMHGHNHAYGNDNYLGGEAIYLPKGEKINIAELGSTTAWTEETLNFTYMNPGYVGYYNDWNYVTTEGTDKLTMTVFAIENDKVTVERYSANGLYNLKSEGRNGRYKRGSEASADSLGLAYNTTVYTSPQTISLGAVEDYGDIGSWVGVEAEVTDDVTTSNKGWVELIAPVPETPAVPGTPESTKYVYTLDTDGTVTDKADAAQGYLIVGSNNASAMTDSLVATGVTITDNAITLDAQPDYEWWITSEGKITDGTNYLKFTGSVSGFPSYSPSGSISVVTNESDATAWEISHSQNGRYTISYDYSYSSWGSTRTATYYLRYNSNAFSVTSSSNTVRLFSGTKVTTPATEGTPAVPGTNGTYGKIAGDLTYNATAGMNADQAMALVKAGIDGYYTTGVTTPGSDVTGTKVYDDDLTWEWVDTFDGNTAGDYAVKISYVYNGTKYELGTAEVVVPATTTYYIAEGNGLYLVDMNTTEANAMATVKAGVTVYSSTDASGSNKTAISDDEVTWNWVDKYNGADSGPYTVEILYGETSLGTVEVKVDVQYETEINPDWTYIGASQGSGGTTTVTYTLDTNGIDTGSSNKYIIVARNQAYLLDAGSARAVTISSDGKTATTNTRDYEYYFTGSTSGLITRDGTNTLYQQNWGIHVGNISDSNLDKFVNKGNGYYRLYDGDGTARSLYYNGSSWTVTDTDHTNANYTVRLYKFTKEETTGGTPGGTIYAKIEGNTVYTVSQGTTVAEALAAVKAGITGYTSSSADGSNPTEIADSNLTWKWKNTYASMVTGSYWVEISYQGKVLGTVEVKVEPGVVNNYPEYPDEGSVKVSKTGTGIDFQSSGIAQVEISASGIPMKKGIDVVIMVDTSSSMKSWCICGVQNCTSTGTNHQRRNVIFEESLENLIKQLQAKGDDGEPLDIRVAMADFNGFNGYNDSSSYGTPYDREENDTTNDTNWYSAANQAKVYTGTKNLTAGAFVRASELSADSSDYGFNYVSGTNYDYAFDAIYQLGYNIKEANATNGENRDLYVVFMSDGAPMQYNYYHSQGNSTRWQYWLTGTVESNGGFSNVVRCQDHTYYYDEATGNQHRMANAVKGSPSTQYEIIRKSTAGLEAVLTATNEKNMYMIPGLGATMFSIAFDPAADGNTPASAMTHVLEDIATEQTESTKYYYLADSASDLSNAFTSIGNAIAYAAYNARFVDQMGDDYDLQMETSTYSVVNGTSTTEKTLAPKIEIISYDIYTRQDYLDGTITEDKIGDRKGTKTVLETVTFSANGKEAYSDKKSGNILVNGVINAQTFWYNTTQTAVAIEGVSIPTGVNADNTTTGSTNVLPAETFYWKMGTVQTSELAMRYYVYLTGSMEGTREAGSYPTNEYATLYYDNYLHNPCYKETVSPVMPWKEANVSYAFYLVDENGNIIVNQTTGQTGSFANKIAVTNPVVYKTVLLNSGADVQAKIIADDDDVLPKYYTLYDTDAEYEIKVASNGTGSWTISKGDNVDVATTYVTQYKTDDASAYSNALSSSGGSVDYTHTIVWFAVKWEVGAHPDSVVVDYGLPVDISVLANDMFGENGKLAGVGAYSDSLNLDGHTDTNELPDTTYTGTYGTAKADTTTGKVRYTLKTMSMDSYEKFAYSVRYTGNENAGYYYDTVTVIPATTIYYEDSFLTFAGNNAGEATKDVISQSTDGETVPGQWYLEGKKADKTQDEDRPGKYSLTDANNIYGYDSVNNGMSMYSLGSAAKVHVDANSYATAEFSFSGTGFDVISMTSNTTGALAVKVTAGEEITMDNKTYKKGDTVKAHFVNTYYGYKLEADDANKDGVVDEGEMIWVVNPEAKDSLYQVPVIQIENLPYAKYDVLITATYAVYMDKTSEDGYDLYLDAIRIYNPANDGVKDDDTTIQDAYKADGEAWPSYIELRNKLIDPNNDGILTDGTLGNDDTDTEIIGEVFIDGDGEVKDAQIEDYKNFGPNNEVYLANGQSVAFILGNVTTNVQSIHLGAKSANGNNVTYTIKNIARADNTEAGVKAGQVYNEKTNSLNTATDMYYDITGWRNNIIVITNTSESILSLTNIKATYKSNPNAAVGTSEGEGEDVIVTDLQGASSQEVYVYMTPAAATLTVRSLNNDLDEPETPDVTEPSQPEESVPEESIPETTEPDVTEPEETEPEETQPDKKADKIQKEIEKALKKAAEEAERVAKELQKAAAKAAKTLSKLFSKWF